MTMSRERVKLVRRTSLASVVAVLWLATSALPASASVTIGQTHDPGAQVCTNGYDWIQPTVSSGDAYVVPSTGGIVSWVVSSWATDATGADPEDKLTFKVFRKVAEPARYQVVVHDGPRTLTPGGTSVNTFATSLLVRPGDVLGLYAFADDPPCYFLVNGAFGIRFSLSNLADGQSADFDPGDDKLLNVKATLTPDNSFSLASTTRHKKKGTATLRFNLPNPGELTGSGQGAKVSVGNPSATGSVVVPGTGPSQLLVKAKGKKKRKLNDKGKVKLPLSVTYTPTGGDPKSQSLKVKLKKKL